MIGIYETNSVASSGKTFSFSRDARKMLLAFSVASAVNILTIIPTI